MKHRGDYGGFGGTLRARFKRSNAPFTVEWAAGGTNQAYYKLDPELAEMWRTVRSQTQSQQGIHSDGDSSDEKFVSKTDGTGEASNT